MKRAIAASATMLTATASWAVIAVVGPGPWPSDSAGIIGATLVALAAISIVGMLVGAARWARMLAILVLCASLGLSLVLPLTIWWAIGAALTALALFGLAGNATLGVVRKLPAATGPTKRVVAFTLVLAALPGLVGLVSPRGLGPVEWVIIGVSLGSTVVYAKAAPFALATVRLLMPLTMLIAGAVEGLPRGLLWLAAGVAIGAMAWTKEMRLAVRPLIEQGRAVPMLAEMVPTEILNAAHLDERGRPRG